MVEVCAIFCYCLLWLDVFVVSDADDMKDIWRKFINAENDWDGGVDCPEVMRPCCLISEEKVAAAIKN